MSPYWMYFHNGDCACGHNKSMATFGEQATLNGKKVCSRFGCDFKVIERRNVGLDACRENNISARYAKKLEKGELEEKAS